MKNQVTIEVNENLVTKYNIEIKAWPGKVEISYLHSLFAGIPYRAFGTSNADSL